MRLASRTNGTARRDGVDLSRFRRLGAFGQAFDWPWAPPQVVGVVRGYGRQRAKLEWYGRWREAVRVVEPSRHSGARGVLSDCGVRLPLPIARSGGLLSSGDVRT